MLKSVTSVPKLRAYCSARTHVLKRRVARVMDANGLEQMWPARRRSRKSPCTQRRLVREGRGER